LEKFMPTIVRSLDWKLLGIGLGLLGFYQTAEAARPVTAVKVQSVYQTIRLTLLADVLDNTMGEKAKSDERRSYHLSISPPNGLTLAGHPGSYVKVTLPTVHHGEAMAQVLSVSKTRIELLLANQVQQLEGQQLKVELPFQPAHLYRIPFQAVYSPRGLTAEVFLLSTDMKVRLVPVVPLQFLSDGGIIVASDQFPDPLKDALVVVQGTDNLLSGDSVQIEKQQKVAP
jgi:hypothetical protein